jgi:hypothetical protein
MKTNPKLIQKVKTGQSKRLVIKKQGKDLHTCLECKSLFIKTNDLRQFKRNYIPATSKFNHLEVCTQNGRF